MEAPQRFFYLATFKHQFEGKDLYLNKSSWGFPGQETSYYFISQTPMLFSERSDLKETLDYFKIPGVKNKITNDIDGSDPKELIIKKVEIKY
jgi:hypothetical protein